MKAFSLLPRYVAAGFLAFGLAGCGGDKAPEEGVAAKGEILPRSVSDDMPPYDTVRSQPPLASPEAVETGTASGGAATPGAASAGSEGDATPDSEPSATPAPAAPAPGATG